MIDLEPAHRAIDVITNTMKEALQLSAENECEDRAIIRSTNYDRHRRSCDTSHYPVCSCLSLITIPLALKKELNEKDLLIKQNEKELREKDMIIKQNEEEIVKLKR